MAAASAAGKRKYPDGHPCIAAAGAAGLRKYPDGRKIQRRKAPGREGGTDYGIFIRREATDNSGIKGTAG